MDNRYICRVAGTGFIQPPSHTSQFTRNTSHVARHTSHHSDHSIAANILQTARGRSERAPPPQPPKQLPPLNHQNSSPPSTTKTVEMDYTLPPSECFINHVIFGLLVSLHYRLLCSSLYLYRVTFHTDSFGQRGVTTPPASAATFAFCD